MFHIRRNWACLALRPIQCTRTKSIGSHIIFKKLQIKSKLVKEGMNRRIFCFTLTRALRALRAATKGGHLKRHLIYDLAALQPRAQRAFVKPARLHFARTARALTGRYMCERGDLSEFLAARTCASYWLDKACVSTWLGEFLPDC